MKILKYKLERFPHEFGEVKVTMPQDATINSVIEQNGFIVIYATTEDASDTEERSIYVVGTGHEVPEAVNERGYFHSTVKQDSFVWHIFEIM